MDRVSEEPVGGSTDGPFGLHSNAAETIPPTTEPTLLKSLWVNHLPGGLVMVCYLAHRLPA